MREYTFRDFNIASTTADTLLFFNPSYQTAVNRAIGQIMQNVPYKHGLTLLCSRTAISIRSKDGHEEYAPLEQYDKSAEAEMFTF